MQVCVDADTELESWNLLEEAGCGVYDYSPGTKSQTGQSQGLAGQHPNYLVSFRPMRDSVSKTRVGSSKGKISRLTSEHAQAHTQAHTPTPENQSLAFVS